MVRKFCILGSVLAALVACTDQQVRDMAKVGEENGQPVYRIETRVRLPASETKIKDIQDSILESRGKRLCPKGYREVGRAAPYRDEYYYNPYLSVYKWGGVWDLDLNTYYVLKQDVHIICTG